MPPLSELGRKPAHVTADEHFAPWFGDIAAGLLNATDFIVAGRRYRFAELEMYYSGGPHADRFSHREPVQLTDGRGTSTARAVSIAAGRSRGWTSPSATAPRTSAS